MAEFLGTPEDDNIFLGTIVTEPPFFENDSFFGLEGNDTIFAGRGDDSLFGNQGNDFLNGGNGNDFIFGGQGDDTVSDSGGLVDTEDLFRDSNDQIFGNLGSDVLIGGERNDQIFGGQGEDSVLGGQGNDLVSGDKGNDFLAGAESSSNLGVGEIDTLVGGAGNDLFALGSITTPYYVGLGNSDFGLITDFNLTEDSIDVGVNNGITVSDINLGSLGSGAGIFSQGDLIGLVQGLTANQLRIGIDIIPV